MSDNLFKVKINFVVFSANINLNQRFVLSLNKENIELPCLELTPSHLENLDYETIKFLQNLVFVNEMELLPQLISIHSRVLSNNDTELNVIYGSVINHTVSLNNAYWIPFEMLKEQKYSPLIFEVVQKLT